MVDSQHKPSKRKKQVKPVVLKGGFWDGLYPKPLTEGAKQVGKLFFFPAAICIFTYYLVVGIVTGINSGIEQGINEALKLYKLK